MLAAGGVSWLAFYLERSASSVGARADHAVPAARSARSQVLCRRKSRREGRAQSSSKSGGDIPRGQRCCCRAGQRRRMPVGGASRRAWGLPIAVLAGRPVGVLIGVAVAMLAGLHLPHRVGWRDLIVAGFTAAIGFSVGLFFTAALFPPGQLRSELSMGVLLSLFGFPLAFLSAWLLRAGRFARE